jgi:hypothetical protein
MKDMVKTIANMLVGAFVAAAVSAALAVTGQAPVPGFQAIDGSWLLGVVQGVNWTYQNSITAHAGGGQTACQNLPASIYLIEIGTVASTSDSVCLPFAIQGTNMSIHNAGAQTVNIFGQSANNLLTGSADTINGTAGSSAYSMISQNSAECFAAKNGVWACVQGH